MDVYNDLGIWSSSYIICDSRQKSRNLGELL